MIKELSILNYENDIYKVFLDEKILYLIKGNIIKEIHKDVLNFTAKYFDKQLLITFYDVRYSIYIVEIYLSNFKELKIIKNLVLKGEGVIEAIDSLSMLVKDKNMINIMFRGWDSSKCKANIFKSNICLSQNLNIITNSNLNSYNSPYTTYCDDDSALMLICKQYEKGDYLLYDLIENRNISNINIPNTSNISLIKYNRKPVVFYNKVIKNDLSLKYRFLNIEDKEKKLDDEKNVSIPKNIFNPRISIYRNSAFIIWYSNNRLNIASSKDLKVWSLSSFNEQKNIKFIKTNIIKVNGYNVENIKTFIRYTDIKKIIKCRKEIDYEKEYNNLNKLLYYSNDFQNKINNLQNCISMNKYYESKYQSYINKISELQKVIDEKDEIILRLLSRK